MGDGTTRHSLEIVPDYSLGFLQQLFPNDLRILLREAAKSMFLGKLPEA